MCDSFDMACHDASSALKLNIKVNSENLLPNSQKYNVGSLRLPADPSWPKIPQRRLADDLGEVIEPPCIVTLTGTPRKSRTTVHSRPSHSHQSAHPSFSKDHVPASFHNVSTYQKTPSPIHHLKRRPGCVDPRFKRITTVKSQMTPSNPPDRDREGHTEQSRSALIIPNQTHCETEKVRQIVPEKDTEPLKVTQREAEKPGEIRGMDSVGVQTIATESTTSIDVLTKRVDDVESSKQYEEPKNITNEKDPAEHREFSLGENVDAKIEREPLVQKPFIDATKIDGEHGAEETSPTNCTNVQNAQKIFCSSKDDNSAQNLTIVSNTPGNAHPESACLQYCQGNAGQFFLVVENQPQAPSLGSIQIDQSPVTPCNYTTQCYNVQVPVLSYQNLPLQISTQKSMKGDIPSQLSLSPLMIIPPLSSSKNHANLPIEVNNNDLPISSEEPDVDRLNKQRAGVQKEANSVNSEKCNEVDIHAKNKNYIDSDVEVEKTRTTLGTPPSKLDPKHGDNCKFKDFRIQYDGISQNFEKNLLSDTTDSELYGLENSDLSQCKKRRRKPLYCSTAMSLDLPYSSNYEARCLRTQESSIDDEESSKPRVDSKEMSRAHRKMKSEQNLTRSSPFGGKHYKNISDPHITVRGSYGGRDVASYPSTYGNARGKHGNRFAEEILDEANEISCNQENTDRTTDDIDSDIPNVHAQCETHRTDLSNIEDSKNIIDVPTSDKATVLPVKTQQLLNKSYMEYYDKLRSRNIEKDESVRQRYVCQMATRTPQLNKRRDEIRGEIRMSDERKETTPEILTLEKLSALSNIINQNLNPAEKNSNDTTLTKQLYVNENMKSSSDPTAGTQSAILRGVTVGDSADLYDSSLPSLTMINKVKRKREKPVERRILKLKTIAFFGFMMYAMIVLLPMMYNYFLSDEYDDYEDLSYIELMLEYVVSSFREAFGGTFDAINDLFFRPVRHD